MKKKTKKQKSGFIDFTLTEKQYSFMHADKPRWSVLVGAVRSGKSFGVNLALPILLNKNGGNAILGFSINTIYRNVLMPLSEFYPNQVDFKRNSNIAYIFGIPVYLFSTGASHHAARLQGMTLSFAYVDEAQLMHPDVFHMLQTRLSVQNAKCVMTANPTNPSNWLYKFIKKNKDEPDFYLQEYVLDDNPALSADFKDNLKRELEGTVFYDRLILGKWTSSEGQIYQKINIISSEPVDKTKSYIVGVDYGVINPCAFVLISADKPHKVIKEYYYNGKQKQLTDAEYLNDFMQFVAGIRLKGIYVDPSATSFITLLKKHYNCVYKANNNVLEGIRYVTGLFNTNDLLVCDNCENLIRELQSYKWDLQSESDKPVKENDHACDALRYGLYHVENRVAQFF